VKIKKIDFDIGNLACLVDIKYRLVFPKVLRMVTYPIKKRHLTIRIGNYRYSLHQPYINLADQESLRKVETQLSSDLKQTE